MKKILKDKGFIACSLVLLIAATGVESFTRALQLHFVRAPVPLRKKLQDFDAEKMRPYKLLKSVKLESEIEEALGTKDYLQMIFEDTTLKGDNAPGKYISFFVTYYTGGIDQVPHVPDVCYQGGGYDPIGSENTYITLPNLGLKNDKLPVRVLFFRDTKSLISSVKPVIYFFSVNGKFEATRNSVRLTLANIRQKFAYFSKVEIAFLGVQPNKTQALELTAKFLRKALPILMKEHWQDWNTFIKEHAKDK